MVESPEKFCELLLKPGETADSHEGIFRRLGFAEPAKAAALWRRMVERAGVRESAESTIGLHVTHLIEELSGCPDPDMALLNLSRFVDALISPSQFFGSILLERPLVHLLVVIFSCSYYLSDILTRNPGYVSWLIPRENLEPFKSYLMYVDELEAQISPFGDIRRRLNSIKRYRRRELLRIGTRDLLGLASVEEVTAELSFLADAVVSTVTKLALAEGTATAELDDAPGGFAVVSLGKLGGTELNYSSDIDLLYVCNAASSAERQEFYTALARRITADLTTPTEEGYLYRVDLRLRPDGESGPLVVTTEEHVNYMLRRARPWERQAFLKARYSAGDIAVADTLIDNTARVTFSTLGDTNPLPDILTMRERAVARLAPEERRRNIKLMSGGIRDIEFITQALQLVHGRTRPEVRSRNTLEALERLHHYGLIEDDVLETFIRCYRLFRTTEHRLQMLRDVRTHTLPDDEDDIGRLGARVAHGTLAGVTAETFRTELGRSIRQVQKLFDAFFRDQGPDEIPLILSLPPGEHEVSRMLERYGIREGETAHRFLSSLVYGDFPHLEPPETMHTAAACLPAILEAVSHTPDPSLSLKNLIRIVKVTGAVRSTLELLAGGGDLLRLLLGIAASSTKLSDVLARRIELLDALAAGFRPGEPPEATADDDALARDLRRWYEETMLCICTRHAIPEYGSSTLGPLHSDALETVVRILYEAGGGETEAGRTQNKPGGGETEMALFALGSLAARRCRSGSDLDLLAVIPDGADPRPSADILRRIIAVTRRADLAEVDPRLRGEGSGSPLAQTVGYYQSYFAERADFWEILTFSRCRLLCGDGETAESFESILRSFHEREDVRGDFSGSFVAARGRLESLSKGPWDVKHAGGGMYDINFILASVNLLFPSDGGRATEYDDAIGRLRSRGLLQVEEIDLLGRAFDLFYLAQHAAALHGVAYPPLPEREEFLDRYLVRLLETFTDGAGDHFTDTLDRYRSGVRGIFQRFVERIS